MLLGAQRTFLPLLCSLESCHPFGFHSKKLFPDPRTNCSQKLCSLSGGNCSPDLARILPSTLREQIHFMCRDPGSSFTWGWDIAPGSFQKAPNCPEVSVLFCFLINLFYLFIFGCIWSSLLRVGFL